MTFRLQEQKLKSNEDEMLARSQKNANKTNRNRKSGENNCNKKINWIL